MPRRYVPDRGDIVWLTFTPRAGHEQAERRPALILSPESYNGRVGLAICCPITSQVKGYPFEVKVPPGLRAGGVVLSDQIKSLDWRARNIRFVGRLPNAATMEVLEKLATLLSRGEP